MANNNIVPANSLALYTWEMLKNNTSMQLINGLIPIGPIRDEPRFVDADAPYLIFGYSEQYSEGLRLMRRGIMSFRVSARTVAEMNEILTVVSRAFEGGDESASQVNSWTSKSAPLIGIRFTSLDTTLVEGGEGSESEGGPLYGMVNIRYNYVRSDANLKHYDPNTDTWV